MNKYKVTIPAALIFDRGLPMHPSWPTDHVIVEADYFRLEGGHLVFRNSPRCGDGSGYPYTSNGYPDTFRAFAPGMWSQVEKCPCQ